MSENSGGVRTSVPKFIDTIVALNFAWAGENVITVIVLTKNEEKNIDRCLDHLQWCDEIIVIDDYSTDKTAKIAKSRGA